MKRAKRKSFEIRFYEDLLKGNPNFVNALITLGDAYTRKGFYREGLNIDKRLATLRPEDPVVHYNLACSLSLVGESKAGLAELKKAVLFGYDEFQYILKDSDLENVRKLPEFEFFFTTAKKLESL